jgi:iron transport multicopper oxidase
VTQCPISPHHEFLYSFNVGEQAGTFWWHSHLSVQYCDGLRGPLVVYDPDDPHKALYDIDNGMYIQPSLVFSLRCLAHADADSTNTDNTVITLADWYVLILSSNMPTPT